MPVEHYENFPVASFLLPARLRPAVEAIYAFARSADDIADEGDASPEARLAALSAYEAALDRIEAGVPMEDRIFANIAETARRHALKLQPLRDLLSAFKQDVVTTRYQKLEELLDYCRRSANPVGRLLLHLYGQATPRNIGLSDAICSALQIINFLQDVAIDYRKNRVYFPQDEMRKYRIEERQIAAGDASGAWGAFMEFELERARRLLQSGAPLGLALPGRIGLEMRSIIAGGERILHKLYKSRGDMFSQRPVLKPRDWVYIFYRAIRAK